MVKAKRLVVNLRLRTGLLASRPFAYCSLFHNHFLMEGSAEAGKKNCFVWKTIDCKTVVFFSSASDRQYSNERSGASVKTARKLYLGSKWYLKISSTIKESKVYFFIVEDTSYCKKRKNTV